MPRPRRANVEPRRRRWLDVASLIVSGILISLTTGMVAAPVIYENHTLNVGFWQIDTLGEALIFSILGVGVGLISIHLMNSLAFVSGRFASLMLGRVESTTFH